jgi:hypothetical protein
MNVGSGLPLGPRRSTAQEHRVQGPQTCPESRQCADTSHSDQRDQAAGFEAFSWLAERVNTFVNVLRPRMRSAAADYQSRGE